MPLILFLKSQLGLFDKIVPVAGSVGKDGTVRAPHMAIRHVRAPQPKAAKPHHHETLDLFAHRPAPAKPKPQSDTLDLFAARPKPARAHHEDIGVDREAAVARVMAKRAARAAAAASPKKDALAEVKERQDRKAGKGRPFQVGDIVRSAIAPGKYFEMRLEHVSYGAAGDVGGGQAGGTVTKEAKPSKLDAIHKFKLGEYGHAYLNHLKLVTPAQEAPAPPAAEPTSGLDYSKPFDAIAIPAFGVKAGTSQARRREINAAAASMVNDWAGRHLEPADYETLRQYSGNGGCGDSMNEFYTEPAVAAAMWKALHDLGLGEGATALEPSCATGVFLETAPKGVKVTGVEMDQTSARIGTVLHPGHEIQNASLERFARQDMRQFDVVIGNAPFGLRGSLIKDDKKELSTADGYFLDTSLDKAKSGGLVAMIVPTGVMNGKNSRSLRERLLRKGEFLGAMRMPNTAFEAAHTDVTADILFFRKRPQDVAGALSATAGGAKGKYAVDQATLKRLGVWDEEFLAGSYFEESGAGNVLGTEGTAMRSFGEIYTVNGSMVGVPEAIAAFEPRPAGAALSVPDILAAVPDEAAQGRILAGAATNPYEQGRRGDTKIEDGVTYVLEGDPLRWHRVDEFMQDKAVTDAQDLAADIERAMSDDGYAKANDLAAKVKAYVEAHGVPGKNTNLQLAASTDKALYRLIGAVKPDGSLSDVVTGRKAAPMESSFDAAAQSLALENGEFTPEQVAGRWHGGDAEAVLDHLYASPDYALDPTSGRWTSADQYLSGELWPKLDAATAALAGDAVKPEDRAKFERQAKLLDETIDPRSLEDVDLSVNAAFLPLDVVAAFFNRNDSDFEGAYARQRMTITFDKGVYAVSGGPWSVHDLLGKYLNRSGVKKDELPTIELWNRDFKAWLCASAYRDQVEELYNRKFRGFRQRDYSDQAFEIPGLNPDGLKPHIYSGIRQALEMGKGILADDVGLGKTVQGLILARMAKVTGQAKKPMIIVPKSVLANWVAEADKWFPGSSVMTIGETYSRDKDGNLKGKPDTAAERNRKYHDLTQNDYDFVLISQPAWNDLDLDPIIKGEYVEDDFWVQRGDSLGNAGDKRTNKIREAYKQALAKREFSTRTDAIYFNQLGVDMLIGDEMHAYKNLYSAKNRFGQSPKFLGGSGLSNRALDMALKTRWVRSENGGKNVFGLTATPTKNSPLEIYSMLTHIAPEAFERIGVRNSEEFLDRFCEFRTENILNTRGEIEEALVTVGFKNLGELREIMRRFINRRTAEMVGLKLPTRDDRQHLVDMSAEQQAVYAELRELAEKSQKDATGGAHIFSIMDKMGKAAMDLELYDPATYAGAHSPKYAEAVQHIAEGAKDGGQVVFADNNLVHEKMAAALAATGIPRDQIAIINADEAESSAKRQNIADAFNAGKLKVVIGNTATMGEGINLQKGTTDVHHMDLPWEPASMQQRNGRGLRQGNLSASVRLHTYLAKGSFDGYRYQSMMAKKDWQDLLWNGGDRVENLAREGALSRDDLMVMLAADPDKAREDMTKNKAAAQERFTAQKNTEAADEFRRLQDMKRSYGAMKPKDREKPAAQRLKVKMDRMRVALEENPHFKAKHALTSDKPILLQSTTGHAYEEGTAFEVPTEGGSIHGGGKFVVTKVMPQVSAVQVRRYGSLKGAAMTIELDKLGHAAPFDYDAKAEQDAVAADMAEGAKEKLANLSSYKDLHGLPSAMIEANHEAIQRAAKQGLKEYKFDPGGYGVDVGLVDPEGNLVSAGSFEAKAKLDTHDLLMPTDAHRAKAVEAFLAAERGKKLGHEYSSGRSGGATFSAKYADANGYHSATKNPWGPIGDAVFGDGFENDARGRYDREQVEKARHASSITQAIADVAHVAAGKHGVRSWPKRGLAVLWAKAKLAGDLDKPWETMKPKDVPNDVFSVGYGSTAKTVPYAATVRTALLHLATATNHNDLAAAMAVDSADHEGAVKHVLGLNVGSHTAPALRHLIAKKPELAGRKAGDFADIRAGRAAPSYGGSATPAHPLHQRFGEEARHMTLADMADQLTDGPDETGGDARHAA